MTEYKLKYGCNPNQNPARIHMDGKELPFSVLNGSAGYINLLDAFNSWQLVKELKEATGLASAASFKHVSPAGAAVAQPLTETDRKVCMVPDGLELSPIAQAYVRARSTDRQSSFGDFVALSDECDESVAQFLLKEVSDGIIAPSYSDKALELLKSKRRGNFLIIQIDPDYVPEETETKQVFGIKFEQKRNNAKITMDLFDNMPTKIKDIPEMAKIDLLISMITLKYTQSNSVVYAQGGQTLGVGAGQQSRILCTRMAGSKADMLWLRRNEKVLNLPFIDGIRKCDADNAIDLYISDDYEELLKDGVWQRYFTTKPEPFTAEEKAQWHSKMDNVALGSDAFFPFEDNIERAVKSGVKYIAQPGGSVRDEEVIKCCDEHGIAMAMTGIRLFHH
ncbi:phosphoribosylaminoimidazolecarboxamide formyltransferase [Eubacterium sp.]|uniref:phosphoribosylaminoimidazolecarboxamide formyltransferase n=1 Tax=Eubacterium sp. TaxID=142586 RepID=UPI002A82E55F|nr:phosphoribosylaminoimidazolecarboxamide formyltransferase [Eubacterium sp.]MDY3811434.1 phosphoribosylaminoimidazolecarboxamide formyltransferase [Eubacterium sp.]